MTKKKVGKQKTKIKYYSNEQGEEQEKKKRKKARNKATSRL